MHRRRDEKCRDNRSMKLATPERRMDVGEVPAVFGLGRGVLGTLMPIAADIVNVNKYAPLVQLEERLICNQLVGGSRPSRCSMMP